MIPAPCKGATAGDGVCPNPSLRSICIWCFPRNTVKNEEFRQLTHAYLAGICANLDCPSLKTGGVEDHVHILCRFGKSIALKDLLRDLKRDSSKWVKAQESRLTTFQWQLGYGAFSISPSHVEPLIQYIANQEEHHRQETFQDEFRRLCKNYGLPIDERYVWG